MKQFNENPKIKSNSCIVTHIKVPSIEVNSQGKEILKAKKLNLNPSTSKPRSASAKTSFREIFQIKTDRSTIETKSFLRTNAKIKTFESQGHNFMDIQYLNKICQQMVKDQNVLKKKIEEQEKIIKNYAQNDLAIPKLKIGITKVQSVRNEDLVTFRPGLSPMKKPFPRDVFR